MLYPRQDWKFGSSWKGALPRETVHSPEAAADQWLENERPRWSGDGTAPRASLPLPPNIDLATSIGPLPRPPCTTELERRRAPRSLRRGFDKGPVRINRALGEETVKIDDPLLLYLDGEVEDKLAVRGGQGVAIRISRSSEVDHLAAEPQPHYVRVNDEHTKSWRFLELPSPSGGCGSATAWAFRG